MNDNERLNLKRMINENNVEDQTDLIRKTKHSRQIRKEAQQITDLRNQLVKDNMFNEAEFSSLCREKFSL